jgi:hypothetical protein
MITRDRSGEWMVDETNSLRASLHYPSTVEPFVSSLKNIEKSSREMTGIA